MRRTTWTPESDKPPFGKHVLCYCRVWGYYIGSYQQLDPDYEWGNWHDGKELGVLPPLWWIDLPEHPEIKP